MDHHIRIRYGCSTYLEVPKLTKELTQITKYKNTRIFHYRCKEDLFPKFLQHIKFTLHNVTIQYAIHKSKFQILINTIKECNKVLNGVQYSINF